jgi:hypothetical protein
MTAAETSTTPASSNGTARLGSTPPLSFILHSSACRIAEPQGGRSAACGAEASAEIREVARATPRRGFGSVQVRVTVGDSTWATSIFPATTRGGYLLPIKKAVRKTEGLSAGDVVTVAVELTEF